MASLDELIRTEEQKTLAAYNPLANTPRYSLLGVLARVRAGGRYLTQANTQTLLREIFPDTATGEALREHWRGRVPPLEANFAQGMVVFRGQDGATIPAGSLWKHRSGQLYRLLSAGEILNGQYIGRVSALEAGSAGNLSAGEALELAGSRTNGLDNTASVAPAAIGGGVDGEDDLTYRARVIAWERQGVRIGRSGDYAAWAVDSSPEVSKAWEFPNFDSSGAILVQVISGSQLGNVGAVQNLAAVSDYLAEIAPVQLVDVRTPNIVSVPMAISLLPAEDTAGNRAAIQQNLRQFWEVAAKPDSSVSEAQLKDVAEDGQAITLAQVTLSNNPLAFSKFELPTQGAITWQSL